jgi:putative membrane protein
VLEILLFVAAGIILGVVFGLIPGIHPNMIILLVPLLLTFDTNPLNLIAMVTALGVSNTIVDLIPSIFLGAPDSGNELAVLPGHRMLLAGHGYEAVKLAVVGSVGSVVVLILILAPLSLAVQPLFDASRSFIYLLLLFIVLLMVLTEGSNKKRAFASALFLASGLVGLSIGTLPLNSTLVLFPIFSGFFGVSTLLLQLKSKTRVAKQHFGKIMLPARLRNRSVIFGSLGGILAGFLPGVGSSEIATMATVDKNDKSFLVTLGALTTANMIFSILTLWLIGRARSGVAIAIGEISQIGFPEVSVIIAVAVLSVGFAALITLKTSKIFAARLGKINYNTVSKLVIVIVIALVFIFTGFLGLLLLLTATALGLLANLLGVKRGNLMGVLILPTILFYAGQ